MTDLKKKDGDVIDAETAALDFDRFTDMMDLDVDPEGMDAEDLTAFKKQKKLLLRCIRNGSLVINDDGEAEYTPQHSRSKRKETITFHEQDGESIMAQDGKKKGQDVAKTYAVMASMCKVPAKTFAGMVGVDYRVCTAIFVLLMD